MLVLLFSLIMAGGLISIGSQLREHPRRLMWFVPVWTFMWLWGAGGLMLAVVLTTVIAVTFTLALKRAIR